MGIAGVGGGGVGVGVGGVGGGGGGDGGNGCGGFAVWLGVELGALPAPHSAARLSGLLRRALPFVHDFSDEVRAAALRLLSAALRCPVAPYLGASALGCIVHAAASQLRDECETAETDSRREAIRLLSHAAPVGDPGSEECHISMHAYACVNGCTHVRVHMHTGVS